MSHENVKRPVSHGAAKMAELPRLENGGSFGGPGAAGYDVPVIMRSVER